MPDLSAPARAARQHAATGAARLPAWGFCLLGAVLLVGVDSSSTVLADAAYLTLSASVVVAILLGVRLHRPADPFPWWVLAGGQVCWVLADGAYVALEDVLGQEPSPSVADALYLAGYAVTGAGLALLVRTSRGRLDRAGWLDGALVAAGLGVLAWVAMSPALQGSEGGSPAARAVAVGYLVADLLLIGVLVRLLVSDSENTWSRDLLVGALLLLLSADVADALAAAAARSGTTPDAAGVPMSDLLWAASYVAWGCAALHPSMATVSPRTGPSPDGLSRQRLVGTAGALLVAPAVLVVQHLAGGPVTAWPLAVGGATIALLVLARMHVALAETAAVVRQRGRLQGQLDRQVTHDALTQLPRREAALVASEALAERARRDHVPLTMLCLDLDQFRSVNDHLGHRAGDEVLATVARRLVASVRSEDVVARLSGDSFLLALGEVADEQDAVAVARRVLAALDEPYWVHGGRGVRVQARVGIAVSAPVGPHSAVGVDVAVLAEQAELALGVTKQPGAPRFRVFRADLVDELASRQELEQALRFAVANDELRVHYQPIVETVTGQVRGFEALVRWERPGQGLVSPGEFLPIAEASDLVCDLDFWVLRTATAQLAAWTRRRLAEDVFVSVNLSGRHVALERVVADVAEALDLADLPAHRLVVEVTETAATNPALAARHLAEIRSHGVRVSLDDFGTGYSSIALMRELPLDEVKIAGEYLDLREPGDLLLLELMIQAGHSAGLRVVGEGVESAEQLSVLQRFGCEHAQGYHLGRPMRPEELELPGDLVEVDFRVGAAPTGTSR